MIPKKQIVEMFENDAAIFRELAELYREEAEILAKLDREEEAILSDLQNPDEGTKERVLSILEQYLD